MTILERLRGDRGRRAVGLGLALLIEAVLFWLLLSLGMADHPGREGEALTVVDFAANEDSADTASPDAAEPDAPERQPNPQPQPTQPSPEQQDAPPVPVQPQPAPPKAIIPTPFKLPPASGTPRSLAKPPAQAYGPADMGASGLRDTERVGTAPNGEPLYAASWYREPTASELRGYLSTASGPGWGLIACRTVPDYRVEDCVPLAEYPAGSQINRAVLAAAWQFRVRPPRLGGTPQVGSWVRIRIDYGVDRRGKSDGS